MLVKVMVVHRKRRRRREARDVVLGFIVRIERRRADAESKAAASGGSHRVASELIKICDGVASSFWHLESEGGVSAI